MPFIPEISASAVAALIGMNPHRAPHEVMYQVLRKNVAVKTAMVRLEQLHNRTSIEGMKKLILEDQDIRRIINDGIYKTRKDADIRAVVDKAYSSINVIAAIRWPKLPHENREPILRDVAGEIHKRRGLQGEKAILDTYEAETGHTVIERNTKTVKKSYGNFTLLGRIDGFVEKLNRVVDSKKRTRFMPTPPVYDEVQMRVYMDLLGAKDAELVENFPDNTTRRTVYENDHNKWGPIMEALNLAASEMIEASQNEEKLLEIIEANTFKDIKPSINHVAESSTPGEGI